MRKLPDLTGKTFGRLTVISYSHHVYTSDNHKRRSWNVRCSCGTVFKILCQNLRITQSCGCLRKERQIAAVTTHGESQMTKEFNTWRGMKCRCNNPNTPGYEHWGGRGIKVCDRWLNSYENFIADMGRAPTPKHTLDRIDNDKGYSPDNCRWATYAEQAKNKRPKKTTKAITHNGSTKTVREWAIHIGVTVGTIYFRLNKGWPIDVPYYSVKTK